MEALTAEDFHTQKYFHCYQSLQLSKWQLPSIWIIWDTGSNMEILRQEILHNNRCQQHGHAVLLNLLNHFYFESFSSHYNIGIYILCIFITLAIFIIFLLSSTVMFFLHCMLNSLRYEKIFCEIDESIAFQHDPSRDVIFLGVHTFSLLGRIFFLRKTMFPLVSLSLTYR